MPRLKRVIVPLSYSSFATESYVNPGDYDKSYHWDVFYGADAFVKPLSPRRFSWVSLFTVKRAVDRTWSYYMEGDSLVEFTNNGWYYSGPDDQRDLERNGKDAGQFHDAFYAPQFHEVNIERVTEMATLCEAKGIQLYLISTPLWPSYLANTKGERMEKMTQTADSLSQALNIPYWNFIRDARFEAADFFDSNHLQAQGARKLTHILEAKMQAYEKP